jgi:hypothetical protein
MPFSDVVIRVRFYAQKEQCAYCGRQLIEEHRNTDKEGAWRAHPVNGNTGNTELSNCVCLCLDCHRKIGHSQDFAQGQLAPRSVFKLVR